MNAPDLIANRIIEFLRSDSYDREEEKKLRQADKVWQKIIMIIDRCPHHPLVTLSNGVIQCMGKCGKLWVPEGLKRKGLYDNNPNVIWIKEE